MNLQVYELDKAGSKISLRGAFRAAHPYAHLSLRSRPSRFYAVVRRMRLHAAIVQEYLGDLYRDMSDVR